MFGFVLGFNLIVKVYFAHTSYLDEIGVYVGNITKHFKIYLSWHLINGKIFHVEICKMIVFIFINKSNMKMIKMEI